MPSSEEINQLAQQGTDAINQLESLGVALKQALRDRDVAIQEKDNLITNLQSQISSYSNNNYACDWSQVSAQIEAAAMGYRAQIDSLNAQLGTLQSQLNQENMDDAAEAQAAYNSARNEFQGQIDAANMQLAQVADVFRERDAALAALAAIVAEAASSNTAAQNA